MSELKEENPKDITAWSYDMEGHAQKCVERCCKTIYQLHEVSTPCLDDHHVKPEDPEIVGEWSNTCSQIVLICLYMARLGRSCLLWTVNYLARSVTKRNRACGLRVARLISYIRNTTNYKQYCHFGNQAIDCKLGLSGDADL